MMRERGEGIFEGRILISLIINYYFLSLGPTSLQVVPPTARMPP